MLKNPLEELPDEFQSFKNWKKEICDSDSQIKIVFSEDFWRKLYFMEHRIDVILEISNLIFANKGKRLMVFKNDVLYRDYLTYEQFNSKLKRALEENALL